MVSSIELDSMKLFLICEDVDFGYYCHGVFDNEDVAKEQMELLIENYTFLKFFGSDRPDNYRDCFRFHIESFILNDVSIINEGIEWCKSIINRSESGV